MGSGLYFHDLPVYRLTADEYSHEIEQYCLEISGEKSLNDISKERKLELGNAAYIKYGPWTYNEVVAYIRLMLFGSQVRGEYFGLQKENCLEVQERERCARTRQKVFVRLTGKLAPERQLPLSATNEEILVVIKDYIQDCRKQLSPKRFIDDEWIHINGPFVDWNKLMKSR